MSEPVKGVLAMIAACCIWGLSSMIYKLLSHVSPEQVLSHRVLWSFVFFSGVLLVQGRFGVLVTAVSNGRNLRTLLLATAMISLNWFVFISAVQIGQATEASLGYYIFPLLSVLLGWLAFGERLSPLQAMAIGLAGVAVVLLTAGLGVAPWISLLLAVSFAIYGVVKKRLDLGPVVSVTAEVLIILPVAVAGIAMTGGAGFFNSWQDAALLLFCGPLTGLPLILFSYAARRIALGMVGVLQYLNPTLQFLVAVLVFGETFTFWHAVAFSLIWCAVAMFSLAALGQERRRRKASSGVSTQVR